MTRRLSKRITRRFSSIALVGAALWLVCGLTSAQEQPADEDSPSPFVSLIKPSQTDPSIRRFDENHYVVFDPATSAHGELVVFMPGTGGKPTSAARLLRVVATEGYRVIGLEYDDEPAVVQVCPRSPSPSCSGEFRRERIFGNGAESIVNRLSKLLEYLDRQHPDDQWASYLRGGGVPDWSRIVVSGLSQGAGMAAYIAKRESVARVVLFSSPWDYYGSSQAPAPWLYEPSATPPERWFAEYHKRENTAALLARAYKVLQIPSENVLIFDLPLTPAMNRGRSNNPFHASTIRVPGYEPQWRLLFGRSP